VALQDPSFSGHVLYSSRGAAKDWAPSSGKRQHISVSIDFKYPRNLELFGNARQETFRGFPFVGGIANCWKCRGNADD
jgi:hypothetical protein